ncbi:MAG: tRNA uridine-5-carboxymethylaminomethyl(34) synthesis GTPase MnmE [Gammaproteobacteria bacterium]|nr:tRNA uridine-5-carboxymethylaminomethyl(34) synthesis GTPase MnmE [Gammaproteobacteria bacterium]
MVSDNKDTIVAQATPPGRGGVGIIRVSGPLASKIAETITGKKLKPRFADYLAFKNQNQEIVDYGIAIFFKSPHSFTGEDVVELQGHGGPMVMDAIMQACLFAGARVARPGEFSQQAFLNNKLDLSQAEAIADLINASTQAAANSALHSLQGEFSKKINQLLQQMIHLRMYVESALDFPEEEIDFLADDQITQQLDNIKNELKNIFQTAKQGRLLNEGMTLLILGKPNAGKSSLLNALSETDSAIVTDIAGTTRDILRESIQIDGMPLHIVDTAGLRDATDAVEQEGVRRALLQAEKADHIILLIDEQDQVERTLQELESRLPANNQYTVVLNKCDLVNKTPSELQINNHQAIRLSAHTGQGLAILKNHLKKIMGFQEGAESQFMARRRHLDALQRSSECVQRGEQQLKVNQAGELLAEELRLAQESLGEITGEFHNDDLLGKIFSEFCIGK